MKGPFAAGSDSKLSFLPDFERRKALLALMVHVLERSLANMLVATAEQNWSLL